MGEGVGCFDARNRVADRNAVEFAFTHSRFFQRGQIPFLKLFVLDLVVNFSVVVHYVVLLGLKRSCLRARNQTLF